MQAPGRAATWFRMAVLMWLLPFASLSSFTQGSAGGDGRRMQAQDRNPGGLGGAERVGVFLPASMFSHGQLYVALSRVGARDRIKFVIQQASNAALYAETHGGTYTRNVVYTEVLKGGSVGAVAAVTPPVDGEPMEIDEDRIDELWQSKAKPPRETFEGPPPAHVDAPHTMDPGDKLYPAPRHTVDVDAEALRASRQQEVRRPRSGWAPPPHFLAGGASPPQSRTAAKLRQCPRCMVLYLAENHTCVPVSSAPVEKYDGRTDTRVRRAVHGRCARPVSFYRIAMSFPRVRDLEFSRCESPRLARLQRDDARRGDACIIDQVKTSSIILRSTTSTLLPIRARARA